ncbi:MAG: MBL fold metallo-hydrolase [Methanothrix sp.]|nr:MBL fold metallo-hydrolase [Methanothrix sp.]OYV12073.1 MAG: Zn-dependent hydrolase [Methanosaeta sp. ASO1]
MKVTWLGHSCFLLQGEEGITILLDPFFEDSVGYPLPKLKADMVMISHDHTDHNNASAGGSNSQVIFGPGEYSRLGLEIRGIRSFHDQKKGRLRGENTIFCFELEGIRICHLGDLGHILSPSQISEIGPVDLLFLPVGGRYTIDSKGADEVMRQIHPALVVPMHYRTGKLGFELDGVDEFLKGKKEVSRNEVLHLTKKDLAGEGRVAVLACPAAEGEADR